jgi:hypothetical protein
VQRLYGKYNPEKLAEVGALAAKYGEDKLLDMVRRKYRDQEVASQAAVGGPSARMQEVRRLYGKYNPEKLMEVDTLAAKYGEDRLLGMVQKKYREQEGSESGGSIPPTTSDEDISARSGSSSPTSLLQNVLLSQTVLTLSEGAEVRDVRSAEVPALKAAGRPLPLELSMAGSSSIVANPQPINAEAAAAIGRLDADQKTTPVLKAAEEAAMVPVEIETARTRQLEVAASIVTGDQATARSEVVNVIITQPGRVGVHFEKEVEPNGPRISKIESGGVAATHHGAEIAVGMQLLAVGRTEGQMESTADRPLLAIMKMIQAVGRPCALRFSPPRAPPTPTVISVAMTKPGPLGLKLVNKAERAVLHTCNPGSQAAQHTELHPGLQLQTIGSQNLAATSFDETMALLKASGRPVTLTFRKVAADDTSLSAQAAGAAAKEWLAARYDPATAVGVIAALQRAEYAEDVWLKELQAMASDGTLNVLLASVEKDAASAATNGSEPPGAVKRP